MNREEREDGIAEAERELSDMEAEILEILKELPIDDLMNLQELADELLESQRTGEDSVEIAREWLKKYYPYLKLDEKFDENRIDSGFESE